MEHEKYSYVEALKWLANKYGIEIEETFASDEQRQQIQVADSL
jgi:DNA primase